MTGQLVQAQTRDEELSKHFRKYDLIRMDPAAVAAQVRNKGKLSLKSSARDFDLQISPNDMRSADYSAQVIDSQGVAHPLPKSIVNTFKGEVKDLPGAQVRMSLTEKGIEGAIFTREKRYFLQPARALSKEARTDDFIFYEASDLTEEAATCGVTLAEEVAAQEELAAAQTKETGIDVEVSGPVSNISPMKIARISTDADGEYVTALGGASQANAQIQSILNMVDGIYQVETGVTFQIVQQNTWADQNTDPYTSSDAGTLLGQFRTHWNANFPSTGQNERSLAHLFTGKNLDGSTIGVASLGVVCRIATSSYGLSQRFPTTASNPITVQTVVLTAHEIGHNFSAYHTNQVSTELPADVERSCEETIMEASVGQGAGFCPLSRSQITGQATAYSSCLTDTATPPPTSEDCVTTPLPPGGFLNGSLSIGDCRSPSRGVDFFADRYSFNGTAGQRVSITLGQSTVDIDPYLYLIGPDGYFVAQDDDGNGGVSSRIPFSFGTITLPYTGVYLVEATSFARQQTGSYSLAVNDASCTISAGPGSFNFPAGGGNSTVNVTLTGSGCVNDPGYQFVVFPATEVWVVPETSNASGTRGVNFTVQANSSSAGRRAFILVSPAGTERIGGLKIPITQSGTAPDCVSTPIGFGQTLNGNLSSGDCQSPVRGNNFFADRYTFNAAAGQKVAIQATAPTVGNPDTFLTLLSPDGVVLMIDDDSGGLTNSRIPGGSKSLTLGLAGTYTIEVTGFTAGQTGSYSLTLTTESDANAQFPQSAVNVNETQSVVNLNVTRSGNISSSATVDYATADNFGASCNQVTSLASAKCDFNTAGGTLRFAAGESSKTIPLSIVNDGYVEGDETFTVSLSNPTGMTLGSPTIATVTIIDNDLNQSNPFDDNAFFVRQQYLDFLLREPDSGGFNDWLNVLNNCPPNQGGLGSDPGCDRVHVSSGFFRSTEFGERGYWSYRYYHAALGRRPQFAEFVPDMRRLSGFLSPAEEEAARAAFVADFMQRPEFAAIYAGLTNSANAAQFIAKLEEKAGVTLPATVPPTQPGQPPQYGRAELIQKMQSGEFTAAQTLRAFIEQKVVFDAFFFRAFVAMQYFGYLLRDPEDAGYNDWVDVLTNGRGAIPPGDFRHLIFGFVWSVEYRQRFGP